MPWSENLVQSTCPGCSGLLLPAEGDGPVFTWARPLQSVPPRWKHHREPPEGFDSATARRLKCTKCERVVLLGEGRAKAKAKARSRKSR